MLSALVGASAAPTAARVTVDDLMKLRTIVDVEISPDGRSVAYAVSTPSLELNAHEVALFVVPATGGAPTPVAPGSVLTSAPTLRWSPDGRTISFLATAAGRTQVYEANPSTASEAPKPITNATTVIAYEWAPDGKSIAYVDAQTATNIWVQPVDVGAPRQLTHFPNDGRTIWDFAWSADGKRLAVGRARATNNIVLFKGLRSHQ